MWWDSKIGIYLHIIHLEWFNLNIEFLKMTIAGGEIRLILIQQIQSSIEQETMFE